LRYPDILDDNARRYYGQIERAMSHAAAIIAVSHSTRRDILELLRVNESKIVVIHEAAAPQFQPLDTTHEPERVISGQRLRAGEFALFVGTVEPRKNLATLLRALRVILDLRTFRRRPDDDPPHLVIAGPRGWLDTPIFKLVDELQLHDRVRFVGGVSEADLVWLYSACRVYLHPELYSGFGLPILEAMQCGAPVVAADTSSLPEVMGSAGLLVPPLDVDAWSDSWQRVWRDESLRERMRAAGFAQAARFSWTTAAKATLRLYHRLAQAG
jgi:glycosyltransferase involved in cell wall biosynthesis